jgi:hypothetical protein
VYQTYRPEHLGSFHTSGTAWKHLVRRGDSLTPGALVRPSRRHPDDLPFCRQAGFFSNHPDSANSTSIIPIQSPNCRFVNPSSNTSTTFFCPLIFRRTPSFHDATIRNVAARITWKAPRCGCAVTTHSSVCNRYDCEIFELGILAHSCAISR